MSMFLRTDLESALITLQEGKTLLYPTDTVWGLGCDATNYNAVEKIYKIKHRVETKSMIILIDSFEKLYQYVDRIPEITEDLLNSITNPVTVIYSNAIRLADNVIAPDKTIGIRIVKDEFCKQLIKEFGKPIVSTSANISGDETPAIFSHISQEVKDAADYIVHYKQEVFTRSKPSTIIRLYDDGNYSIIRK